MREFLQSYRSPSHNALALALFSTPFNANNGATTPADLNPVNALTAFAKAVVRLTTAGIALDSKLGDIQYALKGDTKIPIAEVIVSKG